MKGVVFTEFIEFVEREFGLETAERALSSARSASGGAYTAVGTYDHREMASLVGQVSLATGRSIADLLETFGSGLFGRFHGRYPHVFATVEGTFAFLRRVDGYIHIEVAKLYPDAELPRFEDKMLASGELELVYRSERGLGDLARGLIKGCARHFGERISISTEDLSGGTGKTLRFTLRKLG